MNDLTIIMYHYVRPVRNSDFPGIKGLELEGFKRQLDYLEDNYTMVTTEQVVDSITKNKRLPFNACWLTFDDGYKDHFIYVLPELLKRNLNGAFFPPRIAIQESQMLNVNSIHHILSCSKNIKILINDLHEFCQNYGFESKQMDLYYKLNAVANRFDNKDIIYFKRMLQHVLPEELRNYITSKLFKKYVGLSESEFSQKLYMSIEELKKLYNLGMSIGSHGSMHYWLNKLPYEKQKEDILSSLGFLEEIGASTSNWIMCYPYGGYNELTLNLIKEFGAAVGLTNTVKKAIIGQDNPLTLPRFDTNDFPQ